MQNKDSPESIINPQDLAINATSKNDPEAAQKARIINKELDPVASEAQTPIQPYRKNSFSNGLGIYQLITYALFTIDITLYILNITKVKNYPSSQVSGVKFPAAFNRS